MTSSDSGFRGVAPSPSTRAPRPESLAILVQRGRAPQHLPGAVTLMPLWCPGRGGRRCPYSKQVSLKGLKCRRCTLNSLRPQWGGNRICFVRGCSRGVSIPVQKAPANFKSLASVAATVPFCTRCSSLVKRDLKCNWRQSASYKMELFLKQTQTPFLVVIRRFGRSHMVDRRASKMLRAARLPYLNALSMDDNIEHRRKYF